jgi:hypothetical protein
MQRQQSAAQASRELNGPRQCEISPCNFRRGDVGCVEGVVKAARARKLALHGVPVDCSGRACRAEQFEPRKRNRLVLQPI